MVEVTVKICNRGKEDHICINRESISSFNNIVFRKIETQTH